LENGIGGGSRRISRGLASAKQAAVKTMGFELEEAKAPYEVWVIVSAEKVTEN
jgi:hypothetical protein